MKTTYILQIFVLFWVLLAKAYGVDAPAKPALPEITSVSGTFALYHNVEFTLKNLPQWLTQKDNVPSKLRLFLDGKALVGLSPSLVDGNTKVKFDLDYSGSSDEAAQENKTAWKLLLKRERSNFFSRNVSVSLGYEGVQFPSSLNAELTVVDPHWFWAFAGSSAFIMILFLYLAAKSDIIRVPGPQPSGFDDKHRPNRKPFSLARAQMAAWFFVVLISYVFIWIVTSDLSNLTASVLGMIGISAATGLGAAIVDSGKWDELENQRKALESKKKDDEVAQEKLESEIKQINATLNATPSPANLSELQTNLVEKQGALSAKLKEIEDANAKIRNLKTTATPAISGNFINDILNDDGGISFHRFQIFAWTIVLIVIFISSVYHNLSMPEFDGGLLALMGISSGTYIGFKLPAQQG